ncbi:hypothetical protein MSIM_53540 [Mycobacterium simiae]|nr:hypothetical protein MSIM_53540 [Mycobacterium simiae]
MYCTRSLTAHRHAAVLRETPSRIQPFVDEALRASHAAGTIYRVATRHVVLPNGVSLDVGEEIDLRIGAAGLVFGGGIHPCIGQHLARLEIAVLVSEWVSRITAFDLEADS